MPTSLLAFRIAASPAANAVQAIRHGLPASAFDGVAKVLGMTADDLASALGISMRTVRDRRKKRIPLSREISEKVVRTAHIQTLGRKLFLTDEAVAHWLSTPAPALNGERPLALLDTGIGAREVEAVLLGIGYGNMM